MNKQIKVKRPHIRRTSVIHIKYVCKHCQKSTPNPDEICINCFDIISDETLDELLLIPDNQITNPTFSQLINENLR